MNRNATAIILIVLAAGVFFTFTRGQLARAQAVKAINDEYSSAIKNATELIKVRDAVLEKYNSIASEDRERLDKMLPSTVDNIRLIIDLNAIALRHGFSLTNVKATAANAGQPGGNPNQVARTTSTGGISNPVLDSVIVSFSAKAPYLQFIGFLQEVESSLRIMDLTKLTVKTGETNTYDFGVELKTYWLRQ